MSGLRGIGALATTGACAAILFFVASVAPAQEATPPVAETARKPSPPPIVAGLVFNFAANLRGLEGSQGGIGARLSSGQHALRAHAEGSWSSSSGAYSLGLGLVYEYHLAAGFLSPYAGLSADAGYLTDGQGMSVVPLSAGAVMGVEIAPLDFLSFFIEYAVNADYTTTTSVPGAAPETYAAIRTGMGNASRVGVVVSLSRREVPHAP